MKKVIGVGVCKHPNGRGKPSCEFTIDGTSYYFCYGWTNDWGEDVSPYCKDCPAHYMDAADEVLNKILDDKRGAGKDA